MFEIVSPLAPSELLVRRTRFGAEWRESKIPAALRARGVYRCDVTVDGAAFEMRPDQGRGPEFRCRGAVEAAPGGSRIRAEAALTRGAQAAAAAWVLLAAAVGAGGELRSGGGPGAAALPALAAAAFAFLAWVLMATLKAQQVERMCRTILESVAAARPAEVGAPAT